MQALLDDLGSAESMYRSMYDTSKNSAGSAMRENEVFMKSLQARINLARVEVEKLAVAFGNAFLTEGMVQALTIFSTLTQALSGTVNFIGGLPVIFGAASTALLLLSTRFRGLLTALLPANLALRTYGNDQDRATAAATRAEKRANLASKAYRGLMLSLAGTLPIMVAMFAFEKLLSKISESRQRMEELESANKEMLNSYSSNAAELDILIYKYGQLTKAMETNPNDVQTLAEYRDVQNQIGNLMPSLVTGEDAYGNKIVETHQAMKIKTDLIKEQIALENEKKLAEERSTRDEKIELELGNLEDANDKIADYIGMLENSWEGSNKRANIPLELQFDTKLNGGEIKSIDDMLDKLEQMKKARADAEKSGTLNTEQLSAQDLQIKNLERYIDSLGDADYAQRAATANLKTQYISAIEDAIGTQSEFNDELKGFSSELGADLINSATKENIQGLGEALQNLFTDTASVEILDDIVEGFGKLDEVDDTKIQGALSSLNAELRILEKQLIDSGMVQEDVDVIMASMNKRLEDAKLQHEEIVKVMKDQGLSYEDALAAVSAYSEGLVENNDIGQKLIETYGALSEANEQMVGASSSGVEQIDTLIAQYQMLTMMLDGYSIAQIKDMEGKSNLTVQEQILVEKLKEREDVMNTIGAIYPELLNLDEDSIELTGRKIDAIAQENHATQVLLDAYGLALQGKLSYEQQSALAAATRTKEEIDNIKKQISALETLSLAHKKFSEAQSKLDAGEELSHNEQMALYYGSKYVDNGTSETLRELNASLDSSTVNFNSNIQSIGSWVAELDEGARSNRHAAEATKRAEEATKEATEASKENTEQLDAEGLAQDALNAVTEKYTLTLEKLANAQKKVQNNQKKYSTYSKKYRDALAEENKLIQQQIELNKSQASELEALNGKTFNAITYNAETGQIVPNNGGSGEYLIKNGKLAGWGGVITDTFKTRGGKHRGVDVDGTKGEDLAANIAGKVIKTGWHDDSGNFIEILESATGLIHRYAHLDKITVAVNQLVDIGNKIGTIGTTGSVRSASGGDGSHLHYETMTSNRELLNPMSYVQKAKKSNYSAPTQKAQTVNVNVNNSSSKGTGNFSNANEQAVWNFFKSNGFSDAASAGIIGNLKQESTAAIDPTMPQKLANGKIGVGRGIAQWTVDERWAMLDKWAGNNGKDKWDINTQLEYILMELQGVSGVEKTTANKLKSYGGLDKLKSATSATEAVAMFELAFTRAGKPNNTKRNAYANDALNRLSGTGATTSVSGGIISNGYYTEETTHTLNTLADIEALRAENEELANQLQENYYKSIQSKVEEFEYNRAQEDIVIAKEAERQELMDTSSKEYEESLNKQFTAEQRKISHYEKELAYIKAIRQAGGLTDLQSDQLGDRIKEIETAIMESTNAMNAYYYDNVASHRERYEKRRSELDNEIARQDARQANLAIDGTSYENSVNKQYSSEKKKLDSFQEELRYLQKLLAVGKLTEAQSAEIKEAIYEIQIATIESDNAIKEYYSKVVEGYLARFNSSAAKFGDVLDWEETKIKSVNVSSDRYNKTLQKMVDARKGQIGVTEKELAYAKKQLASGELTSDMYSTLSERVKELKKELIDMNEALHQTNYELIQTAATLNAREIDNIDFTSDKNDIMMGMFDEDSADRKKHMMMELMSMSLKLKELEQNEEDIQFAMRGKDIGHDELEKLEEQLEENALAYWTLRAEIRSTEKALEDFNKQIEDKTKEKYGQVADYILDALKDAYEERKKIAVDAIEKEIKAENERHEKIMKQYDDELEMYNKITNAKLRELDDKDRDRTHNMNIEELTDERDVLQNRANLLSTSTQYADRKEREDLLKQIADIDKQIAEENYNYSLELQKQELNDRLEERTEHIEDLQEKEDKQNEETLEDLETRKEYWEKYYDDIINDEERWYNLREDMLKGNFDEVVGLINENIDYLKPTVADLGLEMDGVWQNVGKSIRENVIWELENMLKELAKVKEEVDELNNKSTIITSGEKGNTSITSGDGDEITEANLKVILAKFMNEQIAGKLDPNTQSSRIKNIKEKASTLAAEGRAEGGNIEADKSLREIFDSLNVNQINQVGDYFTANASESGFITQEYLDYINEFGKQAQGGNLMTTGDMQVLMAKYMKEKLANETKDTDTRNNVRDAADALAKAGRDNTSFISPSVGYDVQVRKLSEKQRQDFGDYLSKNSAIVADGTLRSSIEDYAKRLQLTYSNEFIGDTASMDKGGMTKSFGSSGGVDGKGGRFAIIHENELVSSPVDTKRLLNTASIMDNIFSSVRGMISKVSVPFNKLTPATSGIVEHNTIEINVNIDKFTGTKSALDSLGKEISNRLYVQKGKK